MAYERVHELVDHVVTRVCGRPGRPSLAYRRPVLDAVEFIARHYAQRLGLPAIAAAAGLSTRQLVHVFRIDTGRSVMDYIKTLRVEVAKCVLAEGGGPLEELAERVGFSDSSHLSRVFVSRVGVRPGEYQRRLAVDRLHRLGTMHERVG